MDEAAKLAGKIWDAFCDPKSPVSGVTRASIIAFALGGLSLFGYFAWNWKPVISDLEDLHEIAMDYRTYKATALEVREEVRKHIAEQTAVNDTQNTELRFMDRRVTRLESLPARIESQDTVLANINMRIDHLNDGKSRR